LEIAEDEMKKAENYLVQKGFGTNNFIAVHAGWKPDFMVKSLPPAKLREIFAAIKQRNMKIAMVVGPDEAVIWNKLSEENHLNSEITVIDDISDLRLLATVLAKSRCLISADTGVAHLAAAAGGKTCVIFGPTSDIRCRPLGKSATAVIKPDHKCLNCYEKYSSRACFQDEKCLNFIDTNNLIGKAMNE
jgi:ADP-heptose:LPS heptosyltransferase